jgi:hypothetical protein
MGMMMTFHSKEQFLTTAKASMQNAVVSINTEKIKERK